MKNEKKALRREMGMIFQSAALCKRKIKLADGREHDQVDEFMKLRIRAKLIEKIVNFKILLE